MIKIKTLIEITEEVSIDELADELNENSSLDEIKDYIVQNTNFHILEEDIEDMFVHQCKARVKKVNVTERKRRTKE